MRLVVLPEALHGGEIHALSVSHDDALLATTGKDGVVNIWDARALAAVLQDPSEATLAGLAPLRMFREHQHTVNAVKWSSQSHTFISCDSAGNVFFGDYHSGSQRRLFPYQASETPSGVVDAAWSLDGRLFAWSSLDGKLHLYDVTRDTYQELTSAFEKLTIQRSLAFDPSNNYLVSLGNDTLIYMYQFQYDVAGNYQFRLITKSSKLINRTGSNVNYKRISWSADGEFVSVPTASKNQTALISLISRSQNWSNKISLVGHDLNCEVVKFNPKIFGTETTNVYHVIATAGSDQTLVVWNTSKDSPIFVIKDLATKPIVDLAWDNTGNHLFLGSLDGKLTVVSFDDAELGTVISDDLWVQLKGFLSQYLKPFNHKHETDAPNKKSSNQSIEILDQKDAINALDAPSVPTKIEEKPVVVPEVEVAQSLTTKVEDVVPEVLLALFEPSDILQTAMTTRKKSLRSRAKQEPVKVEKPATQVITTKNGKKRIQPMLISNNNGSSSTELPTTEASTEVSADATSTKSAMEFDKPSYAVNEVVHKENKRFRAQDDGPNNKKAKRDLEPIKFIGSVILNPNTVFSKVRLAVPKVRMMIRVVSENNVLDIKNGQGNETTPSRITCLKKDQQMWTEFVPKFIQLVAEGKSFWGLSTADGQVLTYSRLSGARLLPPLVLGSPLSFLESQGDFLLGVTCLGELYVWNLECKKIFVQTSLVALLDSSNKFQEDGLSKTDNLTMCSVTSMGTPIVTLANGSGYLFNKDLGTWQTITESWWAFGSHYWDSLRSDETPSSGSQLDDSTSILGLLEQKTNEEILRKTRAGRGKFFNKISKSMIMKEGFENLENTISLSHLENRILCCELLTEEKDFHRFLLTYSQRVCELGLKAKLFEICNHLLGPEDAEKQHWDPKVCGLSKHELLKEIVLACANYRDTQRVLIHFGRKIGILDTDMA